MADERDKSPTRSSSTTARSTFATAKRSCAPRAGSTSSCRICAIRPSPAIAPDGNCRVCMVEIEGERVLAASCIRTPVARHEGQDRRPTAPRPRARWWSSFWSPTSRTRRGRARSGFGILEDWADAHERRAGAASRSATSSRRARPQPSGHGGQSRRLHPVQSLRPRLPRSAGQRRHRHGRPRPRREDRVRLRRSDGRLDLRRLRRMRAGLPDRRADAGDAGRREQRAHRIPRPRGRQRLPLLRRRLPAHLPDQERQAHLRRRPRRPGQPEPAVRQGPLRLRLRQQPAAADEAAGAQGRRHESRRRSGRSGKPVHAFPRSHLGRGAGARRRGPEENPRPRRPARARRLRLGQGLERRGLSVPEAGPHRLRHQQCRSLHAAVPRLVGGGAARRRRLGGGDRDLQRVQELRRHHRHRRQPDREPSGRRHLLQAGGQARRQARRDGPARPGA